jgi:hypothetical protein
MMAATLTHNNKDEAAASARKIADYRSSSLHGYLYRVIDWERDQSPCMGLVAFTIRSITPCGVTINFRGNSKGYKFIHKDAHSCKYAHETVDEAIISYVHRKKRHVALLARRLENTKTLLHLAINTRRPPAKIVPEEEPDSFELSPELEPIY